MKSRGSNESCLVAFPSPAPGLHDPTSCPHGDPQRPSARTSGFRKGAERKRERRNVSAPASLLAAGSVSFQGWVNSSQDGLEVRVDASGSPWPSWHYAG